MKVSINIFFCICSLLCFVEVGAQKDSGYSIKAHIEGLKEDSKVVMLLESVPYPSYKRMDSAIVKGNEFLIKGIVPGGGPRFYTLLVNANDGFEREIILFISNSEHINITCEQSIDKIKRKGIDNYIRVDGSISYNAWKLLDIAVMGYSQNKGGTKQLINKIRDSSGFEYRRVNDIMTIEQMLTNNLYSIFFSNSNRIDYRNAIPMIINNRLYDATNHASFCVDIYNRLSDTLRNSYYGKLLKEKLSLCVGQHFPMFDLPTPDGNSIKSDSFFNKNRLTIVHFWASNSYNIDEMQQELMGIYKKYHSKGLNIIGVSSDINEKKWKIAISDIPWKQVSDLKGKDGVVGKIYNEAGSAPNNIATTNVIVDSTGKIMAWDMYGSELIWHVAKIFEIENGQLVNRLK